MAGAADAGPAPQDVLVDVEDLVEGEAGPATFGARRCSVRRAWAAVTRGDVVVPARPGTPLEVVQP
jgi:hypothetical protein